MITNGEGTMNWKCERCAVCVEASQVIATEFEVPQNVINSLMTAATHCTACTKELSAKFIATLRTK